MFGEKEAQYKETISNLNMEVTNLKKELNTTKADLRESQVYFSQKQLPENKARALCDN